MSSDHHATYRVFVFDLGHINAVVEFEAANDEVALIEARHHFASEQRELWQAERFIAKLQPE